jgi:hypothetical protein
MGTEPCCAVDAGHACGRRALRAATLRALVYADSRILWRDPLLGWVLLLPLGLAVLFRVLIPRAGGALLTATGFDLAPYYPSS